MKDRIVSNKKIIGLIILVVIGGYWRTNRGNSNNIVTEKDLSTVEKGSIEVTTQVLGTTQLTTSQKLTFGVGGKITNLYVKPGDKVRKGQVLAQLDLRDINNDLRQQQLSIQNASINYSKLFTNTKEYQIRQAEVNAEQSLGKVSLSDLDIKTLEKERDNKIAEINSNIENAKNKIQSTTKEIEYTIANGTDTSNKSNADYQSQLQSTQNTAKSALLDVKDMYNNMKAYFYMDNTWSRPVELGAKDKTKLFQFENTYNSLQGIITQLESSIGTVNNREEANKLITATQQAVDGAIKSADIAYDVLENSLEGTNLTTSTLNTQKSSILNSRSKLNSTSSALINLTKQLASVTDPATSQLGVDATIAQKQQSLAQLNSDLVTLQASLEKTKLDYELKLSQKKQDVIANQGNAQVSTLNAEYLKQGPDADDKAGAQNQIAQAQVGLAKILRKKEDYQIIAQFDGEVSSIDDLKVGDEVSAMNKGITVQIPNIYEVKMMLDQLDVVKINIGQLANIKIDAYPDSIFTGVVSSIDPTPVSTNGVTSYATKVVIQKTNQNIYNDMTATVSLTTEKKDNILIIPVLSVQTTGTTKSVQVYKSDKTLENRVIIGGISDGTKIEVVSGLKLGEKVTTKSFTITTKKEGFNFGPPRRSSSQNGGNSSQGGAGGPPPQ